MMREFPSVLTAVAGSAVVLMTSAGPARAEVDFDRDVRPILSDACFACHGPDDAQRQADLRLDTRDGLFRRRDGQAIVVPGQPAQSELMLRVLSSDPDEQMPPPDSGASLSNQQREVLKQWIAEGAHWQRHWAFVSPRRPELPSVSKPEWVQNPIDAFILNRLDREGLQPSPRADRRTQLRRVTLDLTGLPPTPEELNRFLKDSSSAAYEKAVDRLLQSPACAERLAIRWLDAARYADTSGYQSDGPRDMWRWRDWVLQAFRQNMPFDRFTIEQLAGDLLPDATLDQKIATGFNRNHRGNAEGGVVPEEFQVEYVVDRVDTTFTVWQGLTIGCGRCHNHKYDPLSQREYYQVFAYFNNIPEYGRAIKEGNSRPFIAAPTPEQQEQLTRLEECLAQARTAVDAMDQKLPDLADAWQDSITAAPDDWSVTEGLIVRLTLDGTLRNSATERQRAARRSATTVPEPNEKEAALQGYDPRLVTSGAQAASVPVPVDAGLFVPGRSGQAMRFEGRHAIDAGPLAGFGYFERFTLSAWIFQQEHRAGTILSKMGKEARSSGYSFDVTDAGTLQLNLVKRWLDDSIRVESTQAFPAGRWAHVCVTYDGSREADGIRFYIDGRPVPLTAHHDFLNQTITVTDPLRIGHGQAVLHGLLDDVRIYQRPLTPGDIRVIADPSTVAELAARPLESGNGSKAAVPEKLRRYLYEVAGPEPVRQAWRQFVRADRELHEFRRSLPTVMIMEESRPRQTRILQRGQYDQPGEPVSPGVPAVLPPLPEDAPPNRLGLARWLVSRENPLTARVTVNRYWRDLMGTGLVRTTEDFGVQGERPSHPELLDWLAVEFMESGWDVRHLLRTIVMSATYQQSSRVTAEQLARDPQNRLLSRASRYRLPAEMIRDQALAVSGLLSRRFGGPSVKPYQPEGLWKEIATDTVYDRATGADLYRRSLYTYWKRTVAPPMMVSFDAPGREMCDVRQTRTNTPLQALNLMNDVTFVEAARVLAQRVLESTSAETLRPTDSGGDSGVDARRLDMIFLRALARPADPRERDILLTRLKRYRQRFRANSEAAAQLADTGEFPQSDRVDSSDVAAWTLICSTILNLDECVTRE